MSGVDLNLPGRMKQLWRCLLNCLSTAMRLVTSSVCWTLGEVSLETRALKRSSSEWPVPSTPVWTLSSTHSQDSLSSLSQVKISKIYLSVYVALNNIWCHPRLLFVRTGRYFACSTHAIAVNITSKRVSLTDKGWKFMYYVNDGVYGSFNCILFDHVTPTPAVLKVRL